MNVTDLVLLDIKHIDEMAHKDLTGHTNQNILELAKYLSDIQSQYGFVMCWYRQSIQMKNIWNDYINLLLNLKM